MTDLVPYITVHQKSKVEEEIRKSLFIGLAFPVETIEQIEEIMIGIRKEYPDATHHCSAYILGVDRNIQRFFDDGEPSGTAGMPILEIIKKEELTNILVVVVRYFGGIKLGAGGLIRAYGKLAKLAIEKGIIVNKEAFQVVEIKYDYTYHGKIENYLMERNREPDKTEYLDKVCLDIAFSLTELEEVKGGLMDITNGTIEWEPKELRYESVFDGKLLY